MRNLFTWAAARLAAAFALALPLAAIASVDYTGSDYEPWSYSAGCVAWRGDGGNFEVSKVADIAADGSIGATYAMAWDNTAATTAHRFCNTQSEYTSPGLTLIYDQTGCAASANATFSPLSFGGLWVCALADETAGTPYSVTGSGTRYTDFGVAGVSSVFKFDKSFTIDRSSATRCYGNVSVEVASGATFTNTAALWIEANSTLALFGDGTVDLSTNGLRMNGSSTLDLSGAASLTIAGNVTLADGATLALPAGAVLDGSSSVVICTGTLAADGAVYVKVGDADAVLSELTISGGAITKSEELTDATFTSNYPTVVPAGLTYTFVGGTESEPVVLDARDVRGTLKTQGYFTFTNYKSAAGSLLDVLSGSLALSPGGNWLKGTLTIEAGATFVNNSTDAPNYNGTFTANVYGALNMGATRWSLGSDNVINLYEGCTVTGSGQSTNGTFDWIDNAEGQLNVYGAVTVNAPVKIRNTATVTITVDADANAGLTLAGATIASGKIVKDGAGLLSFTCNPTYSGITVNNGALTFNTESDVTATVTYPALPTASTSLWYAQQSNWKGTVVINAQTGDAAPIPLATYGNANSTIVLKGLSGSNNYFATVGGNVTVASTLQIDGNVTFNNGWGGNTYTLNKVTGGGDGITLTLATASGMTGLTYAINELDYGGTIALEGNSTKDNPVFKLVLGNIVKDVVPADGKVVSLTQSIVPGNSTETIQIDLRNATLNGTATNLVAASDGIYIAAATVSDGTRHDRVSDALTYVYTRLPTNLVVTVVDTNWVDDGTYDEWFTWNSTERTYTPKAMVARVGVVCYSSLASAIANATAGQTVVLLADDNVSFSASNLEIAINKALTIDGGGFTIYGVNDYAYDGVHDHDIYISGSGDVTIKNVTLSGFGGAAKVNLRTYPIWVGLGYTGTLTLDGVTVTDFNRTAFNFNGGTVVVTNSTITGSTAAREGQVGYFQSGINIRDADVTIADTTITSVGSTFQQEDSDIASAVQLDNNGAGTATISGGTYSGEYGVIVASNANGTVSISGGTFTGNLLVEEGEGSGSIAVSGGTFDAAVPAEYCAEGYEPTVDGDGHYTVRIDMGWIYEADGYKEYTGTWSNDVNYVNGKAHIEDGNTYTASRPSDGRMVTLEMTLSFDDANDEDEDIGDAKAAVKLATNGFKVYTSEGPDEAVTSVWKSVTIEGSDMIPVADQDYKFLFVLDLTNTTYTAALITDNGAATNALVLTDGSVANIPFASRGNASPVQKIEFIGSGSVTSIEGSYEDSVVVIEFVDGQVIGSVTLNAAQAAWLNNQNNYEQLCGKISELTVAAFNEAYLLNLDVTSRAYDGTNVLVSTGIAFGKDTDDNDTVIVTVTLTRHGAIEINGTAAPIIGKLKLMGGNALPASSFEVLQSVEFTDEDFSEGDTTTCTFLKGEAPAKFCKPIIE